MGSEYNNISCFIYKINENQDKQTIDYYAYFEKTPFSEGSFRYCYKGEIRDKNNKFSKSYIFPSGKCVVKVFKQKVAHYLSDFKEDFRNTFYSIKVSELFNSLYSSSCSKLHFNSAYATSLYKHSAFELFGFIPIRDSDSMMKIKENEWLAIEPFLDGKYEKFVSNTCLYYIDMPDETIPFFMHWNWVYSKGESIISDFQGIKKGNYYELTDPAVQSINGEYGEADLGTYGLLAFLIRHKHNQYCKDLPWPKDEDFERLNNVISNLDIKKVRKTTFIFNILKEYNIKKEQFDEIYFYLKDCAFNKKQVKKQDKKKKCIIF